MRRLCDSNFTVLARPLWACSFLATCRTTKRECLFLPQLFVYFLHPLYNIMLCCSIFSHVVLAFERYLAVCHPQLVSAWRREERMGKCSLSKRLCQIKKCPPWCPEESSLFTPLPWYWKCPFFTMGDANLLSSLINKNFFNAHVCYEQTDSTARMCPSLWLVACLVAKKAGEKGNSCGWPIFVEMAANNLRQGLARGVLCQLHPAQSWKSRKWFCERKWKFTLKVQTVMCKIFLATPLYYVKSYTNDSS